MDMIKRTLIVLTIASLASSVVSPTFARTGRAAACHRAGGAYRGWHPRRNEVSGRDNRLGNKIFRDRGQLNGNYKSLMKQDNSIKRQEAKDFRTNGGYITKGQQRQLNKEENNLNKEIYQDKTGK